ncbi:MAG: hypothetical protein J0L77_00365 [Alphaproteobacteria bacterium]|nr:hypothetical protein [Alphaproteobacteria bacterium]
MSIDKNPKLTKHWKGGVTLEGANIQQVSKQEAERLQQERLQAQERLAAERRQQEQRRQAEASARNNQPPQPPSGGSGGGNSGGGNTPSASRPFNYERHPNYPWLPKSGYKDLGYDEKIGQNVRESAWGRRYTDHAIERTLPSGERYKHDGPNDRGKYSFSESRSIMPSAVERTIAYGRKEILADGRINYVYGDIRVGVSADEIVVHTVHKEPSKREP